MCNNFANKNEHIYTYIHPDPACYDAKNKRIIIDNQGLLDFIVYCAFQSRKINISFPKALKTKNGYIDCPGYTKVEEFTYPTSSNSFFRNISNLIIFIVKSIYNNFIINNNRNLRYLSVGYTFIGSFYAVISFLKGFEHGFIIRGDRFKTEWYSNTRFDKKILKLLRIYLYKFLITLMYKMDRCKIWFQGEEQFYYYKKKFKNKKDLFLLNALLRPIPNPNSNYKKKYDLVYCGRVKKEKGVFELFEAFKMLKRDGLHITLNIIGDGKDLKLLKKKAESEGLSSFITYSGYIHDTTTLYSQLSKSKLFILPSYTEGLPRSMLESMALGLPVLVTPVGGIKYLIKDNKNGFILKAADPASIYKRLKYVLFNADQNILNNIIIRAKNDAYEYCFKKKANLFIESLTY